MSQRRTITALAALLPLGLSAALAQTAPSAPSSVSAPVSAPTATPTTTTPTTVPSLPRATTPVTATPSAPASPVRASGAAVSALAIEVSGAIKGRLISCPATLKVPAGAVCLYSQNALGALRPLIRGKLGTRALGDWRSGAGDRTSALLVQAGGDRAYVLLAQLSPSEALVVVSQLGAAPAAGTRPAMPAGIVKGQRYVLDSDLKGLASVTSLGGGSYRLTVGAQSLNVMSGRTSATLLGTRSGSVELPVAAVSDGRNLLFPLDGLRALACTVTPAQVGVTVQCGDASAAIRPIVF